MTLFGMEPRVVTAGAVHLPERFSAAQQQGLLNRCRRWAGEPAGLHRVRMPRGGMMSVRQVCLGWHWSPYRYRRVTDDGRPVTAFPAWLGALAVECVTAAYGSADDFAPDVAIVNHYSGGARMGMHQDNEEASAAPVVSISLGDTALFRLGNTDNRNRPWHDLRLSSGDVFVFGGPARRAFHGVPKVYPGTAPPGLDGIVGRWNITVRQTGL
nr:alpha-ketoglutarate-dependent dioxygenase AlkB [Stackebrandtia endophytica]